MPPQPTSWWTTSTWPLCCVRFKITWRGRPAPHAPLTHPILPKAACGWATWATCNWLKAYKALGKTRAVRSSVKSWYKWNTLALSSSGDYHPDRGSLMWKYVLASCWNRMLACCSFTFAGLCCHHQRLCCILSISFPLSYVTGVEFKCLCATWSGLGKHSWLAGISTDPQRITKTNALWKATDLTDDSTFPMHSILLNSRQHKGTFVAMVPLFVSWQASCTISQLPSNSGPEIILTWESLVRSNYHSNAFIQSPPTLFTSKPRSVCCISLNDDYALYVAASLAWYRSLNIDPGHGTKLPPASLCQSCILSIFGTKAG